MKYTEGEIIRHKRTAHPYLIAYVSTIGLLVVDLLCANEPDNLFAILARDLPRYTKDVNMECHTISQTKYNMEDVNIFTYRKIVIR